MFLGMAVQVQRRGVSRCASTGWDLSRSYMLGPRDSQRAGTYFPLCHSPRVVSVHCSWTCEKFHSYEKYTLRLVPPGRRGTALRPGVHSTCARDRLALGGRIRTVGGCRGCRLGGGAVLKVPLSVKGAPHYHRGDRMLENQLLLVVRFQYHRVLVE